MWRVLFDVDAGGHDAIYIMRRIYFGTDTYRQVQTNKCVFIGNVPDFVHGVFVFYSISGEILLCSIP